MSVKLEKRVAELEKQVALLRRDSKAKPDRKAWLDDLYGKFANDPVFERAMKLGRDYRKSLRRRGIKGGSGR